MKSIGVEGHKATSNIDSILIQQNSPELNYSNTRYKLSLKFIRALDILLSILGLCFVLPACIIVALIIKLNDGGNILHKQIRVGKYGKRFVCYKFRSMRMDAEGQLEKLLAASVEAKTEWDRDHKLKNDPRITRLGKFLRKTSLDELPQLWNVIIGDMSLVGPRPIVVSEIYKYKRSYRYYIQNKPGISGLWQISGRNDTSYNRRVALDRLFIKKYSLNLYIYILIITIPVVLLQKGSY